MSGRILDRSNYSSKTLETFEIISAYYVDIYYNYLYTEAKKMKISGSIASITEGYKHTLCAILIILIDIRLFRQIVYFMLPGLLYLMYCNRLLIKLILILIYLVILMIN